MRNVAASQPAPRMPRLLSCCVFAAFATSSIVMVEPAPCDLLFILTACVALLSGHAPIAMRSGIAVTIAALAFLAISTGSMMLAYKVGATVRFQGITIYVLLCFGIVTALIERYGVAFLRVAWAGLLFTLILTSMIGLLAHYRLLPNSQIFFRDDSGLRVKSTFKDPNVFGPFLAMGATVLFGEMLRHAKLGAARLGAFGLCCYLLLLSFSRGAWINFAAGMAVFVAIALTIRQQRVLLSRLLRIAVVLGLIGVPVLGYMLVQTDLFHYLESRLSLQSYDSERFGSQARALDLATVEFFGIGPGQWVDTRFGIATHNLYLRVLAESGWLGLASFGAFILTCVAAGWQGLRHRSPYSIWYAGALAVIAGTLLESVVIDTLHWRHFFWFLALPVGLLAYERRIAAAGEYTPETVIQRDTLGDDAIRNEATPESRFPAAPRQATS
ncbi:MAG: O-antigen ligase family protein [Planctomycetota bacterium]